MRRAVRPVVPAALVAAIVMLCVALLPSPASAAHPPPLRDLADLHGLAFGTAANLPAFTSDRTYRSVLAKQFNSLTPENEMKWDTIHPSIDSYDFTKADKLVRYAERNGMVVRGGPLVWWFQNPPWLVNGTFTRDEWIDILRDHITTVVGHYRGRVAEWDVVNEGVSDAGGLRSNPFYDHIGPEYLSIAFEAARRAADPDALLFYNDYGAGGVGAKADAVFELLSSLVADGVPIDGFGSQTHFSAVPCGGCGPNAAGNMARYAAIGLDVAITEMDVRIALPSSPEELALQADLYSALLQACLDAPNCHTFTMWGFTDRYSWIPLFYPGFGEALIYDVNYVPKPAEAAIRAALGQ